MVEKVCHVSLSLLAQVYAFDAVHPALEIQIISK